MFRIKSPSPKGRPPRWDSFVVGLTRLGISTPPVLRDNPIIRRYLLAQFVSYLGSWLQSTAISVLILQLTHSSSSLTIAVLVGTVSNASASLLGGWLADRYPPRSLMVGAQIAFAMQALVLCLLQVTGHTQIWHLYVLQALANGLYGLNGPAEAKLIGELVKKEQLKDTFSVNAICLNIAWIAGPPLAGVVIGLGGIRWLFFANAISYIFTIVYLFRLQAGRDVTQSGDAATANEGTLQEAFRFIRTSPMIWLTLLVSTVYTLCNINGSVLQPLIGMRLGGVHAYTLISMSNGVGCLIGASCLIWMKERSIRELLVSAVLTSSFLVAYGLAPGLLVAMVSMALATIGAQMFRTSTDVLVQSKVPPRLQGRVNGIKLCISTISVALSNMVAGFVLVPTLGAPHTAASSSGMGLVVIGICWLLFRRLRRTGKLEEVVEHE